MTTNYPELRQHLEDRVTQFGRELPGPMTGFARLHKKAVGDGALSAKVKEMMALAISVAVGCEGCIAYHVHDAIKAGATRPELLETIGVGVMMAGGPGTIYAAHALDAVEQFLAAPEPIPAVPHDG
jgi:AhpD family alkylhydroperoxidase